MKTLHNLEYNKNVYFDKFSLNTIIKTDFRCTYIPRLCCLFYATVTYI